jgi:hypothetical protein
MKERQPPQKAANVSVVLINQKEEILTSVKLKKTVMVCL